MIDPEDSLVSPPRRSPIKAIVAITAIVAVAFGAWWVFGRGKGQPETPTRVLIIGPTPSLAGFLERKGFDAEYLSFGAAVGEGQVFDSSLDGVAAILEHADQHGIGYVALSMAHGEDYELDGLDYEAPEPPPGTTFMVLSVGDLGRHVSYGGVVPEVEYEHPVDEEIGLVLALFGQPEITKARTREADNELMIRFGSAGTVEDVVAWEKAQENMRRQIKAWEAAAAKDRGEPRPIEIAAAYERLRGWPLANGTILLARGRGAWRSDDGLASEWDGSDLQASLSVVRADALDQRIPCDALPDTLPLEDGFAVAPAGDALLIPTNAYVASLWVLGGDDCGFEQRDEIRRLGSGELGQPRASGRTAASSGARLAWADAKMRAYRHARFAGIELADALRWVDDETVVIPATLDFGRAASDRHERALRAAVEAGEPPPTLAPGDPLPGNREALVFVRLPPPKQEGSIELAVVPVDALLGDGSEGELEAVRVREVFPLASEAGVVVALVETPAGARLIRASVGSSAWLDGLATDYDLAAAAAAGRAAVDAAVLATDLPREILDLAVSPTGSHAAWSAPFGEAPDEAPFANYEIVALPLGQAGATPIRLTDNERSDLHPRFAGPDGRLLIFDSNYRGAEKLPEITALRALPVP